MSATSGDKARHNRERRKKLARRVSTRALRATLDSQGATTSQPKAGAAPKGSSKK